MSACGAKRTCPVLNLGSVDMYSGPVERIDISSTAFDFEPPSLIGRILEWTDWLEFQ
jgi:hypothetical protein